MVQPINYSMNVLNPIEGYLQGLKFGEGILSARQQRAATEQDMRIQQATFEEQQRARAEARATAARKQAQAEAGKQALIDYFDKQEARTATPSDLRRAILQFPGMAEQFQAVADSFSEERLGNEHRFGKQLSFALARGQIDAARNLLEERMAAATEAGDERSATAYRAKLQELEASPEGLLMQTLMPLASTMEIDDFDKFYKIAFGDDGGADLAKVQELKFRAKEAGLVPGTPEYEQFMLRGGAQEKGPIVQNIIGDSEGTLAKELAKGQAKTVTESIDVGSSAARNIAEIDNLENILSQVETGAGASVKAYLGQFGVDTEGLDLIQAAEAAINRLVPAQRTQGSGTMSDQDLALFKRSLPSLINQPGGNKIIIDTLRAMNEYDVARAVIAGKISDWVLTPKEDRAALEAEGVIINPSDGRKAIMEIPNPLASFSPPKGQQTEAAAGITKEQFMQNPDLAGLDDAMKEKVWENYKKLMGIK